MSKNNKKLKAVLIIAEDMANLKITNIDFYKSSSDYMVINGKEINGDLPFTYTKLLEMLSGRIDSDTTITVNAHGNIFHNEHAIKLSEDNNYPFFYTAHLIGLLQKIAGNIPLQINLNSCHSGDGLDTIQKILLKKTTIITNSKEGFPSTVSLDLIESQKLFSYFLENEDLSSPYLYFNKLFEIKASQYAKFVTKKNIFSIKPPFESLLNLQIAKVFLEKEQKNFKEFAAKQTWKGKKVSITEKEFSNDDIKLFSGNLFYYLCSLGEDDFVHFLEENLPTNQYLKEFVNYNSFHDQPINIAAIGGHAKVIEILLANGANVDSKGKYNSTPLFSAVENDHYEVAKLLLSNGANVDAVEEHDNLTPLLSASSNGNVELITLLLENQADINKIDINGTTPIMRAINKIHIQATKTLLKYNSDIEIANADGTTALYLASEKGLFELVEALLQYGAEIDKQDNEGITSLYIACQNNHYNIVKLLIEKGANVNIASSKGISPLLIAIAKSNSAVAELLIEAGANIHYKSDFIPELTILDIAKTQKLTSVEKAIENKLNSYTTEYTTIENDNVISIAGENHSDEIKFEDLA